MQVLADGLAHRGPRAGIEAADFADGAFGRVLVDVKFLLDFVPVLAGELFVAVLHNALFRLQQRVGVSGPALLHLAAYLDEEAFLQVAGAQAGRVEVLDDVQHLFQFLGAGVDTRIDGQFVADAVQGLAQQPVVVQRPDEVFGQFALPGRQVLLAQLFFQRFVERGRVREGDFFRLVVVAAAVVFLQLIVGDVVLRQVVAQRVVVRVASVLRAFAFGVGRVGIIVGRRLLAFFQGRVFQQFGPHAVFQLHGRQFQQLHYLNLLWRQGLHLLLRLRLDLSGGLCHFRCVSVGYGHKCSELFANVKRSGTIFHSLSLSSPFLSLPLSAG